VSIRRRDEFERLLYLEGITDFVSGGMLIEIWVTLGGQRFGGHIEINIGISA